MTTVSRKSITFDASAKERLLLCFDKTIDDEGYLVEIEDPTQRVITQDGDEITIEEFGGIRKGSEIFFKTDILSLIEFADTIK